MQTPSSRIVVGFQYVDLADLELPMYVVYDHPTDFPDSFVSRLFNISKKAVQPTDLIMIGSTLDEIRKGIPDGCLRLERSALDDPSIVESWV